MKAFSIALGVCLAVCVCGSTGASAQKIIHVKKVVPHNTARTVRVRKFGHVGPYKLAAHRHARGRFILRRKRHGITIFSAFALPDQHLFPPYYEAERPWAQRPDMASRIEGGKTVEGGSRFASHIAGGKTVEQGSPWRSTMANWRFTGYEAPMRPRGIPYYRAQPRARSPWSGKRY